LNAPLRAGKLDHLIVLQRKSNSYSPSGAPIEAWSNLASQRWSDVEPITGTERSAAQQWIAREQTKFTLRWSPELDDLSPLDRVVFPSDDSSLSPVPSRSIYDIIAVHQPDRLVSIIIMAARRVG